MQVLFEFLKPYKKECIIGPIFKLLEAFLELLLPTIMILIVNNGIASRDSDYIVRMGFIMLLMSLLGFGASVTCQYLASKASQGYGTDLRNALFTHISSFSYSELDHFGTSTLTTRLTNDINQLQVAVAMLIRLVFRAPFICIGAITMSMILNFKLSLILLGVTPLFILVLYFIISKTAPLYKLCQQTLDTLSNVVRENLSGVRVIRAFSKTPHEIERFKTINDDLNKSSNRAGKIAALLSPATSFIVNMTIIVILWVGGGQINLGNFTQGEMIAYINYITQILLALIVISNLVILYTKAYTAGLRVAEVLNTTPSIVSNMAPFIYEAPSASHVPLIAFHDVCFSYYQTADTALEHIDLTIYQGETIGIIGATGSGKTTLVNLMGRFYDISSGEIIINGMNIKDYSLSTLRNIIGYVPQKSILLSGTLAENLRLGNKMASDDTLKRAAHIAQLGTFIDSLPDGYHTVVARGGENFSGGQKQRLAIARALVANPKVLILDDSSSALDFATEASLRKALRSELKDMTVITISQRASSIRHCDQIIVMNDGKIVGKGTHHELVTTCPVYHEICLSQMTEEEMHAQGGYHEA